jgi:hypothetical protein
VKADKMSVSFGPDLAEAIRAAAASQDLPVSTWLADAAASKLRAEGLAAFLDEWEAEHGAFTAEELAAAERELRLPHAS